MGVVSISHTKVKTVACMSTVSFIISVRPPVSKEIGCHRRGFRECYYWTEICQHIPILGKLDKDNNHFI
jgi:hypothetical protein